MHPVERHRQGKYRLGVGSSGATRRGFERGTYGGWRPNGFRGLSVSEFSANTGTGVVALKLTTGLQLAGESSVYVTAPAYSDAPIPLQWNSGGGVYDALDGGFVSWIDANAREAVKLYLHTDAPSGLFAVDSRFNAPDGTLIENYTSPNGETWSRMVPDTGSVSAGAVTIEGNALAISTSAQGAVTDSGLSDFDMACGVTLGTGTRFGLILRAQSNGNMLILRIRQPNDAVELMNWSSGSGTDEGASEVIAHTASQRYEYRVRAEGSRITAWRDGVQLIDRTGVTSTFEAQTRQGFTSFGSSYDERYHYITVRPIGSYTPVPA